MNPAEPAAFKTIIFSFIALLLTLADVPAGEIATTKDGRNVLLKDDGTWEYIEVVQPAKTETEQARKPDEFDFKQTRWGMSKPEVKSTETGEIILEKDDMIVYKGGLAGLFCNVFYFFDQNKLVKGKYHFTEQHENKNDHIAEFQTLKTHLIETYGQPVDEKIVWKKETHKQDREKRGLAVSLGHLTYSAGFQAPDTDINLLLSGENALINLAVEYRERSKEKGER